MQKNVDRVVWPGIVFVGFVLALAISAGAVWVLRQVHISFPLSMTSAQLIGSVIVYILALCLILTITRFLYRPVRLSELGIRWLTWRDIGVAVAAFIVYAIVGTIVMQLVQVLFPGFDANQTQDLGFKNVYGAERLLAFFVLVVVAPIAEELVFRGFLYGKLRHSGVRVVVSLFVTSLLFAVAHLQLNVGIDVFVLSVFLCLAREYTGGIGASILIHMFKNGIAFYVLFIAANTLTR